MGKGKRKGLLWLIVGVVLVLVGVVWFGVSSFNRGDDLGAEGRPLLVVELTGGLCGEGVICKSEHPIKVDGSFSGFRSLTVGEVDELKKLIKESRLRVLKETNTKMCASYYDGTDLGIRVPSWGDKVYTPCLLLGAENDRLVVFVEKLLG